MRCTFLMVVVLSLVEGPLSYATGRELYGACASCHAASGWGSNDGTVPSLAGQQERYLEKQLALFRSGARVDGAMQAPAMHPRFTDRKAIAAIALYLAGLAPNPSPVKGSGAHLREGLETYARLCSSCHGSAGRGEAGNRVPRIAGQHYPYLKEQIEAAAHLHKSLAPPEMVVGLGSISDVQRDALADYLSRLGESLGEPGQVSPREIPR